MYISIYISNIQLFLIFISIYICTLQIIRISYYIPKWFVNTLLLCCYKYMFISYHKNLPNLPNLPKNPACSFSLFLFSTAALNSATDASARLVASASITLRSLIKSSCAAFSSFRISLPPSSSSDFVFFSSNSSSYFSLNSSSFCFVDVSYFVFFGSSMPYYILRNYFIFNRLLLHLYKLQLSRIFWLLFSLLFSAFARSVGVRR